MINTIPLQYRCTLGIFFKRSILAIFPIYCFHFLVVHTMYALRKCHCISKIYLRMIRLEDSESTYDCNLNLPHYICRKFWLLKLKPPVDQPVLKMCNKAPITYNTMTAGYFQGIQQHLQMVYSIAFIYGSSQKIGKEQLISEKLILFPKNAIIFLINS